MRVARLLGVVVLALLAGPVSGAMADGVPHVRVVVLDRAIDPVTSRFVIDQIHAADRAGETVVIRLDTPGGLDSSMREIIKAELGARVPVLTWVGPDGARSASAGVFLMMASDLAAMAPQTNVGSSTPVVSGGDIPKGDLKRKILNDAVARIRVLATEHGRNADWAEQAVRKAANVTAREALSLKVIEFVSPTIDDLLTRADSRTVVPKRLVLHTAGATVSVRTLPLHLQILDVLIDPNLLYLLLLGGLGLLAFEVAHPGVFVPGILGGLMLTTALFGLSVLPFTWTGLLFLVAGVAMIVAETHVGHGALGALGTISLVVGALLLFDTGGGATVSIPLALGTAAAIGAFFVFVISRTVRARRLPVATGVSRLVGREAEVREALDPDGLVFLNGELWQAVAADGPVAVGTDVVVDRVDGLRLHVHPAREEAFR